MTPDEHLQSLLHAHRPAFAQRVATARAVIDEALAIPGVRFYLAFSGGVDSTVLLDLLRQHPRANDIDIIWGDNGWDLPDTLAFLSVTEARYGFRLIRMRTVESFQDFAREMGRPDLADDPNTPGAWGNPCQWDGEWWLKDTSFAGYDGVFLGWLGTERMRRGESHKRVFALHHGYRPLYQVARDHHVWHCSPLASWTKYDVWAYVAQHNLPYNTAYDKLAEIGVPLARRRVSELTCYRVVQFGSHALLAQGWPATFNAFAAVFPQVRTYV